MKIEIDQDTVLIKIHYFLFFAGLATSLPYLTVYGLQVGIPIDIMGGTLALILIGTVILKPLISGIADSFPSIRRGLFLSSICITAVFYSSMGLVNPFGINSSFESVYLFGGGGTNETAIPAEFRQDWDIPDDEGVNSIVIVPRNGSCLMKSALACDVDTNVVKLEFLKTFEKFSLYSTSPPLPVELANSFTSLDCRNTDWEGDCASGVWNQVGFWWMCLAMFGGSVSYSVVISFTDAIIMDTIKKKEEYGRQRTFGSLGWGTFGLLSGLLISYFSPPTGNKNYSYCFIVLTVTLAIDFIVATRLQVPAFRNTGMVWPKVKPLVKSPQFLFFLFFSLLNGVLSAVVFIYLFVLQDEMAVRTSFGGQVKMLQGFSIMCRSFSIVPFLWVSDRILKRFDSGMVMSFTFLVHCLRLLLLVAIFLHLPVWCTLFIEILAGPSYGLACPTIVTHAGRIAPEGASTTVQSLASIFFDILGYAVGSVISGSLVAKTGLAKTFLIWSAVAGVGCVLHGLYDKFVLRPNKNPDDKFKDVEPIPLKPQVTTEKK